jgi:hypothetical protein
MKKLNVKLGTIMGLALLTSAALGGGAIKWSNFVQLLTG